MPLADDYPFCPFLSITETGATSFTVGGAHGESYCDSPEDYQTTGWMDPYEDVSPSLMGCGLIYDCCATITPVACWKDKCMMWNEGTEWCGLPVVVPQKKQKFSKAAILVNEYLGNEDLDENGKIYGVDFHISGGFEWIKTFNGYDENGNATYVYIDELGVPHNTPGGTKSNKPPALKGVPDAGIGMTWSAYLASVED